MEKKEEVCVNENEREKERVDVRNRVYMMEKEKEKACVRIGVHVIKKEKEKEKVCVIGKEKEREIVGKITGYIYIIKNKKNGMRNNNNIGNRKECY